MSRSVAVHAKNLDIFPTVPFFHELRPFFCVMTTKIMDVTALLAGSNLGNSFTNYLSRCMRSLCHAAPPFRMGFPPGEGYGTHARARTEPRGFITIPLGGKEVATSFASPTKFVVFLWRLYLSSAATRAAYILGKYLGYKSLERSAASWANQLYRPARKFENRSRHEQCYAAIGLEGQ